MGANGFCYQQVSGDSGEGAAFLGHNEGTDIGVGPVISIIHTSPKYNYSVQVKWLPEVYTKNRLNGDWVGHRRLAVAGKSRLATKLSRLSHGI